ncbi:MAG: carbamoyltransferase HypF [Chlorobiaceae bacterium]|nr:carbamoyltransferase HypF [Chlorobiaceae bacterium]
MADLEAGTPLKGHSVDGPGGIARRQFVVAGIVQGVGFRPFVWRLAGRCGLGGFIRNTSSGVLIEVEGPASSIDLFTDALVHESPPLARIASVDAIEIQPVGGDPVFEIAGSTSGEAIETLISPDIATCGECLGDLDDADGRRFRYPFTNCTNCGPRYTIVEAIPYDRPFTTMKEFELCHECGCEYRDPGDRRFHAQPNACPVCGPRLELLDAAGTRVDETDPLSAAARLLRSGAILAVKGIGGFHLAVDARDDEAVRRLRQRKGREEKPFAVMVRDLDIARSLCSFDADEAAALESPEAPIVLLRKSGEEGVAGSVAPGNDRLGVMLPYSPLHHLFLREGPDVLVMTSANLSEEPLAGENGEALERLTGIAEWFLMHDRPIAQRCDDSVAVRLAGSLRMIRRSRGYVPAPIHLADCGPTVLATGGELKNALCLAKGSGAIMSQHIGDMKNYEAWRHFDAVAAHLQRIFRAEPELIVHDLHPSYLTTQWAQAQSTPLLGVQHHHAHLASVLAENLHSGPAIGIMLDGSGYGTDGTAWGGEVLVGDAAAALRFASLEPMPLPGGDASVRHVWRAAIGFLHRSGVDAAGLPCSLQPGADEVLELLDRGTGCAETSSCGRLFDAVASICGLRHEASYEGQAAVELMQAAVGRVAEHGFGFGFERRQGRWLMLTSLLLGEVAAEVRCGMGPGPVSRRFHRTLSCMFSEVARMAYLETGLKAVALGGGVCQNELLLETLVHDLETNGFKVLLPSLVPTNDGGLSLGQAVIGREYLKGRYRGIVDS